MDAKHYRREREKQARKAIVEFREFANVSKMPADRLRLTVRLIYYMVRNMGFNTVVAEQMPNWILGHMVAFAMKENKRAKR